MAKKQLNIRREALTQQPLLKVFNSAELDQIVPYMQFIQAPKSHPVIPQGHLSGGIYILLQGRLKIYSIGGENQETGVTYITPSQFFGELSVIDNIPSSVQVETLEDSILILIPSATCQKLMMQKPEFTGVILQKLANSIRTSNHKILMLNAKSSGRVLHFLRSAAHSSEQGALCGPMLKHDEIATMTNLSRETVSRSLSKLKKAGQLTILDSDQGKLFKLTSTAD
jgi:CRP-like cAMP-binding protein